QSFLFAGPRQLGKFLVALEFAQKLSGAQGSAEDVTGDVLVIGRRERSDDKASKAAGLSVSDIRHAEAFLSRFPGGGKYRVVIIDEADQLTHAAENALLKILEEPNSTSVIILVTHVPGRLLPTVRSRLFTVAFAPLAPEELQSHFPKVDVPDFFFSLGLPGLIEEAAVDPMAFAQKKELLRGLFRLSRLTWAERLSLAERLASQSDDLPGLLELWLIGLERQRGEQAMQSVAFVTFLDRVLETLDQVSQREGNPRLMLERLFTYA
ncbi:MAG: AAA family ATPase, partial [Candidatus Moraniibacteriota bacterium]